MKPKNLYFYLWRMFLCILVFVVIFASVPAVSYLINCFETPYSFYETYNDLDSALSPPADFPSSARNIHSEYNLDSNAVWLLFDADMPEVKTMSNNMDLFDDIDNEFGRLIIPDGKVFRYEKLSRDKA